MRWRPGRRLHPGMRTPPLGGGHGGADGDVAELAHLGGPQGPVVDVVVDHAYPGDVAVEQG